MRYRALLLSAMMAILAGCTTSQMLRSEPDENGTTRIFHADSDTLAAATADAMRDAGLEIESDDHREDGATIIVAHRDITAWSWGELIRAIIQPAGPQASVRILTERAYMGNPSAKTGFTEEILTRVGQKLGEYP